MRTITSHYVFKQSISITQCRPPQLPENFSPYITRTFTRMKYSYSSLNAHLYPYNLVPSATCSCRTGDEDCFHFFYNCPFYDVQRERMIYDLTNLGVFDLRIDSLIFCERYYDPETALGIQRIMLRFIMSTGRFWLAASWPPRVVSLQAVQFLTISCLLICHDISIYWYFERRYI